MINCKTVDIEGLLQQYLENLGYTSFAPPVPPDLGAGYVGIYRTGGSTRAYVQDVHQLSIDCYESSEAQAMELACDLTNVIRSIGDLGVTVYETEVTTLPYSNPDPRRGDLCRATFAAQIVTRTIHQQ